MEQEQLISILEALLFVSGRPLRAKDLAKILELPEAEIKTALESLTVKRKEGGIILLENNGEYQLSTNSKYSTQVKNFLNAELREKLTDATVEVLAIIAYRQPISKAELEAIRGVNSQYSIRNLLMRGLVEKIPNPNDARSFLYQTTTEFLMHLGMNSVKELPEFEKLVENIKLPQTPALTQEAAAEEAPNSQQSAAPATDIQNPAVKNQEVLQPSEVTQTESDVEEGDEDDEDDEE